MDSTIVVNHSKLTADVQKWISDTVNTNAITAEDALIYLATIGYMTRTHPEMQSLFKTVFPQPPSNARAIDRAGAEEECCYKLSDCISTCVTLSWLSDLINLHFPRLVPFYEQSLQFRNVTEGVCFRLLRENATFGSNAGYIMSYSVVTRPEELMNS